MAQPIFWLNKFWDNCHLSIIFIFILNAHFVTINDFAWSYGNGLPL